MVVTSPTHFSFSLLLPHSFQIKLALLGQAQPCFDEPLPSLTCLASSLSFSSQVSPSLPCSVFLSLSCSRSLFLHTGKPGYFRPLNGDTCRWRLLREYRLGKWWLHAVWELAVGRGGRVWMSRRKTVLIRCLRSHPLPVKGPNRSLSTFSL